MKLIQPSLLIRWAFVFFFFVCCNYGMAVDGSKHKLKRLQQEAAKVGLKFSFYPVKDSKIIKVFYSKEDGKKLTFEVLSLNGKVLAKSVHNAKHEGRITFNLQKESPRFVQLRIVKEQFKGTFEIDLEHFSQPALEADSGSKNAFESSAYAVINTFHIKFFYINPDLVPTVVKIYNEKDKLVMTQLLPQEKEAQIRFDMEKIGLGKYTIVAEQADHQYTHRVWVKFHKQYAPFKADKKKNPVRQLGKYLLLLPLALLL
ncbi:hypothetical protein AAG747_11645 [Rapidithrix thailandica]|uniref:Uncharacterized protein n=1 Tax=Rapidithrix thailandica TaxID=413964 RepID=A0AAW9SB63_9BACT